MKKVSIIIPIYNTEKYLEKCLSSVCCQTYKNLEIICINDGSTDRSGEIAEKFAKKDSRIILKHQKNSGESAARNIGLQLASGEYIGFIDCDDWIEEDMYDSLVKELENENADIAVSGWYKDKEYESIRIKNEKEITEKSFSGEKFLEYLYERDSYREFAYMWDKLYKRKLFYDENGEMILFDTNLRLGGDVLCLGRIALNVKKAVYLNRAFYHYIQREDSGCHSENISKRIDWLKAYIELINIFYDKRIKEDIIALLKRFLVYHSAVVYEMSYKQGNKEAMIYCGKIIADYGQEYERLNADKPERIEWLKNILSHEL